MNWGTIIVFPVKCLPVLRASANRILFSFTNVFAFLQCIYKIPIYFQFSNLTWSAFWQNCQNQQFFTLVFTVYNFSFSSLFYSSKWFSSSPAASSTALNSFLLYILIFSCHFKSSDILFPLFLIPQER
jgi:hypothetical protein